MAPIDDIAAGLLLLNAAIFATAAAGMGLLAERTLRPQPAPLRYAIILASIHFCMAVPGMAWLAHRMDLGFFHIRSQSAGSTALRVAAPAVAQPEVIRTPPLLTGSLSTPSPPQEGALSRLFQQIGFVGVLLCALAVGVAVGLIKLCCGLLAIHRLCRSLTPPRDARLTIYAERAAKVLGLTRVPQVYCSQLIATPLSFGVLAPKIVFPDVLEHGLEDNDLEGIFLHETAHIAHRDYLVGAFQRVAGILFWWHPLIHRLNARAAEIREEICDNYVLKVQGGGDRFARCLVDLAERTTRFHRMPLAAGLLHPRYHFEARVKDLLRKDRNTMTRLNMAAVMSVVVFSALSVGLLLAINVHAGDCDPPPPPTHDTANTVAPTENIHTPTASVRDPIDASLITLEVNNRPLKQVLDYLSEVSGKEIKVVNDRDNRLLVSFKLENVTCRAMLDFIALKYGMVVDDSKLQDNVLLLDTPKKISMVFQRADIRHVINTIAIQSNANIVIGPEVTGEVSMRLENVPWNEALNIVAKTLDFVAVREANNTIRITSPTKIAQPRDTGASAANTPAASVKAPIDASLITLEVNNRPLKQVLDYLSEVSGKEIQVVHDRDNRLLVSFKLENVTIRAMLDFIAHKYGMSVDDSNLQYNTILLDTPAILSMVFQRADIRDVINTVAIQSGVNIVIGPDVRGEVTLKWDDVPWNEALERLAKSVNCVVIHEANNTVRVISTAEVAKLEIRIFRLAYLSAQSRISLLDALTKEQGPHSSISFGEHWGNHSNDLIVRDTPENLDKMQAIIDKLDRPAPAP